MPKLPDTCRLQERVCLAYLIYPHLVQAFGINGNIYHKLPPKLDESGKRLWSWDVLMVGHFLPWKRHLYLATLEGRKLAVGEIYQVAPVAPLLYTLSCSRHL